MITGLKQKKEGKSLKGSQDKAYTSKPKKLLLTKRGVSHNRDISRKQPIRCKTIDI